MTGSKPHEFQPSGWGIAKYVCAACGNHEAAPLHHRTLSERVRAAGNVDAGEEIARLRARCADLEAQVVAVRADERQRIVERLLHAANVIGSNDVSRTALTLEKMAAVLVAESPVPVGSGSPGKEQE
jgi:hypothetical protein